MKHVNIKKIVLTIAAFTLISTPVLVSAKDGSSTDDSTSSSRSSNSGKSAETSVSSSPRVTASPKASSETETKQHLEAELKDQLEQQKQERVADVQAARVDLHQKLDDGKKKICETHQRQINNVMNNMDQRRQNAYDRITTISTAVQKFYDDKSLTITNYDDLVAQVSAAQTLAASAMTTQKSVPQFNCDSSAPRADVADFRTKRSDSIDAMEAYRKAVKALVEAVKTATKTTSGGQQ